MHSALDDRCPGSSTREDCLEQVRLIECYRRLRSRELGRELAPEVAAEEWVTRYAAVWRRRRESCRVAWAAVRA